MNILKKYKSKSIAIIVSLLLYGLMFLLLAVIPGIDTTMNTDESITDEESIQFQLLEDIALRSMSDTKAADKTSGGKVMETTVKTI